MNKKEQLTEQLFEKIKLGYENFLKDNPVKSSFNKFWYEGNTIELYLDWYERKLDELH